MKAFLFITLLARATAGTSTSAAEDLDWSIATPAGWWTFRACREPVAPPEPVTDTAAPPLALKADDARANWSRASFSLKTADGLRQTSGSSWSVKGGRAFMQVRRQDDGSLEPPRSNRSSPRSSGRGCRGVSANDVNSRSNGPTPRP
jgi:hypothetical protein